MLGLFFILPVAVNLPDSWFGVVIVVLLIAGGAMFMFKGAMAIRHHFREQSVSKSNPPS